MRILFVFAVAFGLPLVALAQPAAKDGKSTEVSELIVEARKATTVSELTITASCPIPAIDSNWPDSQYDAPADTANRRTEESLGTRAFILSRIVDARKGAADYAHMGVRLSRAVRSQMPVTKLWIICRGAFKDIKFLHVSKQDLDDFEVDFEKGAIEWEVKPLDSNQVVEQSGFRIYYPRAETRKLEDFLTSIKRGQPNYADLTPESAAAIQAQWPDLQASLKAWGPRGSLYFTMREDDGSYLFRTLFKHGQVLWSVGPLDAKSKITKLSYAVKAD
jgi:hypothetical protein